MEKYGRPSNCTDFPQVKVNKEAWSNLNADRKQHDLRLANLQQTLQKIAFILLQTANFFLLKDFSDQAKISANVTSLVDAIALLAHSTAKLSSARRSSIKPALRSDYQSLCSNTDDIPFGPLLFGEDFGKTVKDLEQSKRVGRAFEGSKNQKYPHSSQPQRKAGVNFSRHQKGVPTFQPTSFFIRRPTKTPTEEISSVPPGSRPDSSECCSTEKILSDLAALKSVSQFPAYLPTLLSYLHNECANFEAGRVSKFLPTWRTLTHDPEILMTITGVHIELDELPEPPKPRSAQFTEKEREVITAEIKKLLAKRVLELTSPEPGQIISPIFLIPKQDGTHRMILNLKHFNNYVTYRHFKMDTLSTVTQLMSPQCFMASLDLKDAYYSIPIAPQHRKFLRFEFNGQLLQGYL